MRNLLQILIRPESEFRTRKDVAIHMLNPTVSELLDAIDVAERDMFDWIIIYVPPKRREKMSNIFASNSLWNQLRRSFGDVRYGEVGVNHGRSFVSKGDGFQIYFE